MRKVRAPPFLMAPDSVSLPIQPSAIEVQSEPDRIDIAKAAKRWRYDKDLKDFVEITDGSNYEPPPKRVGASNLVKDIENYVAVGIQDPKGPKGTPLVITKGRRQHHDELRSRGLHEAGNDRNWDATPPQKPPSGPDVREAMARAGMFDGARSMRDLKRQGRL